MSRLFSRLAAFLIAGAAAHASLADASAPRSPAPALQPVSANLHLPSLDQVGPATGRDWVRRVDARLGALTAAPTLPTAAPTAANPHDAALAARLGTLADHGGKGVRVAVHVRDLGSGETVFDEQGDRRLNPASNQKILTAVAAVELLGADYQFRTRLARHGDALYLIGGGDPTLQVHDLYALAQEAIAAGAVEGVERIVVDDSAFSPERFGPGYDAGGPGVSYMAPSGALSLAFNTIQITVRPGAYGKPVGVQVAPASSHVRVEVDANTGAGRGLRVDTIERDGESVLLVSGSLTAGHAPVRVRRRIYDPGLFGGGAFAQILAESADDIALPVTRGVTPAAARTVATHDSVGLTDALDAALKYSNNFAAEQVLRTLGWRASGEPGSWDNGTQAVSRYWQAVAGPDGSELEFINGSGLSRTGRATPRALVDLVARTQRESSEAAALASTLAGAGLEGTLRLRVAQAQGRVRAKTGTMNGVSALSGVAISEDGARTLGFSILVNGGVARHSRALQDRMVLAMLAALDDPTRG